MHLPIAPPRVKYAVAFPFLCFHKYHLVWFWGWLTVDWRWVTIEKRQIKNVVVPHCTS
jgi:hypothetical protein